MRPIQIVINTKTTSPMPGTSLGLHIYSFKKPLKIEIS